MWRIDEIIIIVIIILYISYHIYLIRLSGYDSFLRIRYNQNPKLRRTDALAFQLGRP